ncbi:MAG: hypothetical protein ACLQU5_18095 [Isosphaeraceae bacterium]
MTARTIMPVLPHEDPKQLKDRTQQFINDMQPRSAVERDLVCHAARLSWAIERAERVETAHPRKMRNSEWGMEMQGWRMTNAGWQMSDAR